MVPLTPAPRFELSGPFRAMDQGQTPSSWSSKAGLLAGFLMLLVGAGLPAVSQAEPQSAPLASRAGSGKPAEGGRDAVKLPVAMDLSISGDASASRLTFTLSAPLEPKVNMLEKPDRLVLDLPEVNFQIPAEAGKKTHGLVKSVRYGLIGPGRSRVVIELAQPALPASIKTEPVLGGAATTLVLDLRKADREAFSQAAVADRRETLAEAASDPGTTGSRPRPGGDRRPVVVLDPGHGGIDVGATGLNDTVEKDVVLAFAQTLKNKLEAQGLVRVVMTRSSDEFVSLGDRVRVARAQEASLFVSIHADTVRASPEVRGLTVYTNSDRASDAEAARLAESENRADQIAGVESEDDGEEVSGILGDLLTRETRTYSHLFARTLVGQITAASKLNKNPHRSARFMVLRAPDVPSVLIELGYLSSKSDVELLKTEAWREKASDSVASAIASFISPRLAQGSGSLQQ
jgi:N-acetylmuramoyl-L-alanine amidase